MKGMMGNMRYELKYIITPAQYVLLKNRLKAFMQLDEHSGSDSNYFIRSVYFDSEEYEALYEKNEGIPNRRKYRLRFYNGQPENCRLECKIKAGTRVEKKSFPVEKETVRQLLDVKADLANYRSDNLVGELQMLMQNRRFRPVVVVDYLREAYVYPLSDLRITFDKEIAAGNTVDCLIKGRYFPNILPNGWMVLEVKYNQFMPDHISRMISSIHPVQTAVSKYVMCAMEKREGRIL